MRTAFTAVAEGVLPYLAAPALRAGPVAIQPFGLLVGAGIVTGAAVAAARARRLGLDEALFTNLALVTLLSGLATARLVEVVLSHPWAALEHPWDLLLVQRGLSSFGGFVGATAGFVLYARGRLPLLPAADALACGLPVGWLLGRVGCALAHDHLGIRSEAAIAVAFPGGARLDLGLLELALTPLLVALVMLAPKRWPRPGSAVAALAVAYALLRFSLELLRAPEAEGGDVRYLALTPAQYGAIALLGAGILIARRSRKSAASH